MECIHGKYDIIECSGILDKGQLERVLRDLPIEFYLVDSGIDPRISLANQKKGIMEVYHRARVVSLYPLKGKKLSNAHITNWNFPLKPDNIMDDNIGLRCCFHPKLTSFHLNPIEEWDEIEIDIYKFYYDDRDGIEDSKKRTK